MTHWLAGSRLGEQTGDTPRECKHGKVRGSHAALGTPHLQRLDLQGIGPRCSVS